MQKAPKKQHEVIIIGSGPLSNVVATELTRNSLKPHRIPSAHDVHFIGNNLLVHAGEKIGFKRVLLLVPNDSTLPTIKGQEKVTVATVGEDVSKSKAKYHIIIGSGTDAVNTVIQLVGAGLKADVIYSSTPLKEYDMSVQDAVRRHLKSIGVTELANHLPIATTMKASKTMLLVKNGSRESKQFSCDQLHIEKTVHTSPDIGLENQGFYGDLRHRKTVASITVMEEAAELSLGEIRALCEHLRRGKGVVPEYLHHVQAKVGDTILFSMGQLEQDMTNTHLSYKKSITRISEKTETFHGFIKIITTMKGGILSVSGILPAHFDTSKLLYAVRSKLHIKELAELYMATDPLREELLETVQDLL